jgi:V/A-type H+/Na+-transporting ATPase subunit D
MAKVALNKSSLKSQKDLKDTYEKFLPSLDLKKQQLLAEAGKARNRLQEQNVKLKTYKHSTSEWVALLGSPSLSYALSDLVKLSGWETRQENVAGVILPVLGEIHFQVRPYTLLGAPVWFDSLVDALKAIAQMTLEVHILTERVDKLDRALKKVTQRINLFEQVLIPECQKNMRVIKLFIEDNQRTAVCRSKLAKAKLVGK